MKLVYFVKNMVGFLILFFCFGGHNTYWKLTISDPILRRRKYSQTAQIYIGLLVKVLNTHLEIRGGQERIKQLPKTAYYMGNHLGFLDVLLFYSKIQTLFVTSLEMKNTPFLGLLTEMGGSLYVDRKSRTKLGTELAEITNALKAGFNVVIYPEATSTDGEQVYPFRKGLIMASQGTEVPIQPITINYLSVDGHPMEHKWRDYVCWYGDQAFVPAMIRLLTRREIRAELVFGEPILVTPEMTKDQVAEKVREQVSKHYFGILYPPGVPKTYEFSPPRKSN